MTELSTNPITHVIVFHDKSKKFITEAQSNLIFQASCGTSKSITTPQLGLITFSAIAKIIELKEFYDQYPDERPEFRPEFKPEPRAGYKTIEEQSLANTARRSGLAKGLKQFIRESEARGEDPLNAKAILERWEKGIKTDTKEYETGYHQKTVDKFKDVVRDASQEAHYQFALGKVNAMKVM